MRRLIFPSSVLVLAAALCALAVLTPAGAAGSVARSSVPDIICPVQSAQPNVTPTCCPVPSNAKNRATAHFVPCCPYPTNTCCPATTGACCTTSTCCTSTTTCCTAPCTPGGLSIASSPDPSTAGRKVVISGGMTSDPTSGVQVALWRKLSGQSSFQQIAQTTTDSAGRYTFTMKPGSVNADQRFYVTANGVTSPTVQQEVDALVGLIAATHTVGAGQAVALSGHVTPSHAGQVVLIEQRRGGSWAVIGRPRLSHASKYAMSHKFTHAGAVKLRAVLPGDARNNRSSSTTLTLRVT